MFVANNFCGLAQVARAGIVAKARPMLQNLILRCIGKRSHIGKTLHEALEVGNYCLYLGLLQHDLGHPDAVRVPGLLPGKVLAAIGVKPAEQSLRKISQ